MATAPTLYWYQLDSGTLSATYFGQLNTTVAALCSENAVTAPTAQWQNSIGGTLHSKWMTQVDTAVRSLCTILVVTEPISLNRGSNAGQYQSKYMESLDACVRALCAVVPGYHADAVHFDGNSYLGILSLLTVDSFDFSCSAWIKTAANQSDGTPIWVADADTQASPSLLYSGNAINLEIGDNAVANEIEVKSAPLDNGVWNHILISTNTNHPAGEKLAKIYLNDVDVTDIQDDGNPAFVYELNGFSLFLFGSASTNVFTGDAADFWFAPNQSLLTAGDIPEATRRKFISAALKPVSLGANGELPTGTIPTGFWRGNASAFPTNRGIGGASALTGSLTDAATSPSD